MKNFSQITENLDVANKKYVDDELDKLARTVNNGALTLTVNGTAHTFTANQSEDTSVTINDTGVTSVSLTGDGNAVTNASIDGRALTLTKGTTFLTSQSIKTLNTNNTTAQTTSASETIVGSGTINLHKVSKTGSYNDLLNKLTAGSNITISKENIISAKDTTYTAGTGLSLLNGAFSVKTGYSTNGKNYKVTTDTNGNLYVNVPWTDTDTNTHNSHAIISGTKSDNSTQIKGSASSGDIILGDSGASAGSYGNASNQEPGYGTTFNVPYITVNAKGIVTAISNKTVKIPASDNTNTATAADNILDGSNSGTQITYAPYTSQQSKLSFDTSTTNPTRTDRLN